MVQEARPCPCCLYAYYQREWLQREKGIMNRLSQDIRLNRQGMDEMTLNRIRLLDVR